MTTSTSTTIQLGDIHFPELRKLNVSQDQKDPNPPTGVARDQVGRARQLIDRIKQDIRGAAEADGHPPTILICGDLTNIGDLSQYRDCAAYFATNLLDSLRAVGARENYVHLVPGNHDVDYKGTMPFDPNSDDRFEVLVDCLTESSPGVTLTTAFRTDDYYGLNTHTGQRVMSLNSCTLCGAPQYAPPHIERQLEAAKAIATKLRTDGDTALLSAVDAQLTVLDSPLPGNDPPALYRQLDIPSIPANTLQDVTSAIAGAPPELLPIVLAHHNVMPQRLPRIDAYTEMLNSGQVRSILAGLGRAVVWLHGHIHEDIVEIVRSHYPRDGLLVLIAAPKLQDGYNVVRAHYSSGGTPIGLELTPVRAQGGILSDDPVRRIPLALGEQLTNAASDEVIHAIVVAGGHIYAQELLDQIRADPTRWSVAPEGLQALVEEILWTGQLHVDDRTRLNRAFPDWVLSTRR